MGYGRSSHFQVNAWMDELMALDLWATLLIDNPFITDPAVVEIPDVGFNRVPYTPNRVSYDYLDNANLLAFLGLAPGTSIVATGVFDAETAGQLRFATLLDTPYNLPSGGNYSIAPGLFGFGLDVGTG